MVSSVIRAIFALTSLIPLVLAVDTCYWPNGEFAASEDMVPCTSISSDLTQCCARNEACLSNGMCFSASTGGIYRGACTDSKWSSTGCPQFCNTIWATGNAATTQCPQNGTVTVGGVKFKSWCGSDSQSICLNSANGELFDIPNGNVSGIAGKVIVSVSASSTATSSTTSSTATSSTSPGNSSPTCAPSKNGSGTAIGVGVGVGIPLALLAAALGTLYMMEKKKRITAERSHLTGVNTGFVGNPGYGGGYTEEYKVVPTELNAHEVHEMNART